MTKYQNTTILLSYTTDSYFLRVLEVAKSTIKVLVNSVFDERSLPGL